MSRRHVRNSLLAAGVVLAAFLAIRLLTLRTPFDRSHFDQLRTGMTAGQVEQVLGGPARNEFRGRVTVWQPRDGSTFSYDLRPNAPTASFFPDARSGSEQRFWIGEQGLIAVLFDADGRMLDKYYSDVHVVPRPGAMDLCKHVLGL